MQAVDAPLVAGLTAYTKLLYQILPSLLRAHGCAGAARDLTEILSSDDAETGELVDALDECMASANEEAAHQHLEREAADRCDQISSLARHLAQHETLQLASPGSATRHLERALEIAADLGHPAGPVGVVH